MLISQLLTKLDLDSSSFTEGMNAAEKKVKFLDKGFSQLGALGGGILQAGLVAGAAAAVGLAGGLALAVAKATEAQEVEAQLDAVLASTAGIAGVTKDEILDLAKNMSLLTKFDDEAYVSASTVMLQFTNISDEVFPAAIKASADLATRMKIDLPQAAQMVGKALGDPVEGIGRLNMAFRLFNDEELKTVTNMAAMGDVAGAQQMVLDALTKSIGGASEAAGKTFSGRLAILKTQFDNVLESVGLKLLPYLENFTTMIITWLNNPATQNGIAIFADQVGNLAAKVVAYIPTVVYWFQQVFGWLTQNQGIIVAVLAVIGAAILTFLITTTAGLIAALPAFFPLLAVILLIGGAAYLLYQAWTTNFGGIQEKTAAVWAWLQPILQMVMTWLQTNIPVAIQFLADFWQNRLLPAIQAVWSWMNSTLFPFFQAFGNFVGVLLVKDFEAWAYVWDNRLKPALSALWSFLQNYVWPILQVVGAYIGNQFKSAFLNISKAIEAVTKALQKMTGFLRDIKIPSWLTPGSPTPFELGLRGIASAMGDINGLGMTLAPVGVTASMNTAGGAAPFIVQVQSDGVHDEYEIARKIGNAIDVHLKERGLL